MKTLTINQKVFKHQDTQTKLKIALFEDNNRVSLDNNADYQFKIKNSSGYLKSETLTIEDNRLVLTTDKFKDLTPDAYSFEVWENEDSIYPSENYGYFKITKNVSEINGETIPVITIEDFEKRFDEALKKVESIEQIKGDKGDTGPQGPKGDTGPQGIQGPKGEKGDVGPAGKDGATDPQGERGPQGPKGEKGDTGERGPQGLQGPVGPQGPKGERGEVGPKGEKGDTGLQGEKGDKGDKGDTGERGADGKDGRDGVNGKDGINGTNGRDGIDGKNGQDGKSAYQIWLDLGNSGSEQDFIDSLKAKGDTQERHAPMGCTLDISTKPWTVWFDNGCGLQMPSYWNNTLVYSTANWFDFRFDSITMPATIMRASLGGKLFIENLKNNGKSIEATYWDDNAKVLNPIRNDSDYDWSKAYLNDASAKEAEGGETFRLRRHHIVIKLMYQLGVWDGSTVESFGAIRKV